MRAHEASAATLAAAPDRSVTHALMFLAAAWLVEAVALRDVFADMWRIWTWSDSHGHGFVVLPIVGWLVWRDRRRFREVPVRPGGLAVPVAALCAALLVAGTAVQVSVVAHFAAVGLLVATFWAVLGTALARALAFPLAFAFFAVPFGEFLVPPLMDFTARFALAVVSSLGIPAVLEGRLISLPGGDFAVERACSGIRYLTAALCLGSLYAYVQYGETWKRWVIVGLCVVLPILANGVRAAVIILLAHYSDQRLAVGVDHFIYGGIFFALVMLLVLAIARLVCGAPSHSPPPQAAGQASPMPVRLGRAAAYAAVCASLAVGAGAVVAGAGDSHDAAAAVQPGRSAMPSGRNGWVGPLDAAAVLGTVFRGAARAGEGRYLRGSTAVHVSVFEYGGERRGAELVSSANLLFDPSRWRWVMEGPYTLELPGGGRLEIAETIVSRGARARVVWRLYAIDGRPVATPLGVKLRQLAALASGRAGHGAAFIASAETVSDISSAREALRDFMVNHYTTMLACVVDNSGFDQRCAEAPSSVGTGK